MSKRNDPTAFVDGMRVVQPYTPRPLTAEGALLEAKKAQRKQWGVLRVFLIAVVILIITAIIARLTGGAPKSFLSFLYMLQDVPSITTEWMSLTDFVLDLPSWLDWIEPFANIIVDVFKVLSFLVVGVIQALTFVLHILRWVFAV